MKIVEDKKVKVEVSDRYAKRYNIEEIIEAVDMYSEDITNTVFERFGIEYWFVEYIKSEEFKNMNGERKAAAFFNFRFLYMLLEKLAAQIECAEK